ncbi:hypothetical protein D039_4718B, partial [Vibrio parahaemolyticus EKP-028]
HEIGIQVGKFLFRFVGLKAFRLVNRDVVFQRQLFYWWRSQFLATTRWTIWVCVNRDYFMLRRQQRRQVTGGEIRSTCKDNT